MWVVAPALFFLLLWATFIANSRAGIRTSFLYATTVFTLCLVVATELFSVGALLRLDTLATFWTGLAAISALYLWFRSDAAIIYKALGDGWRSFREFSPMLLAMGLILATVLLIAVVSPPNNWDSMTVHMSRVVRWIQQGSVEFLVTTNHSQNHFAPLTGYAASHLQILADGDRFANTVQWFTLVGCGIATSLIARELKQPASIQILAAIIAVTLPAALMQASNTKDDLAVAFWIVVFALGIMWYLREPTLGHLLFSGLALGFALLTKGTAYLVASVCGVVLFIYGIYAIVRMVARSSRTSRILKLIGAAIAMLLVALSVNSGYYARMQNTYGYPVFMMGSGLGQELFRVDEVNLSDTLTNIIHSSAQNLGLPVEKVNDLMLDVVRFLGISEEDVGSLDAGELRTFPFRIQEDNPENPLHFLLLSAACVSCALFRRRLGTGDLAAFLAAAVVIGILLYSMLAPWRPFNIRYFISFFMLGASLSAVFVAGLVSVAHRAARARMTGVFGTVSRFVSSHGQAAIAWIFLIASIPYVVLNEDRPIFGAHDLPFIKMQHESIFSADRLGMYFNSRSEIRQSYFDAVDYLAMHEPSEVGLNVGADRHEYPIHMMFKDKRMSVRFDHVGLQPDNPTVALRDTEFKPPFIFDAKGNFAVFADQSYRLVRQYDHAGVWKRVDD